MNTTHLALSEPGAAPVTADETSPLGRRRTRGFSVRAGERERARSEMTAGVEEEGQAEEPCVEDTVDTFQREHKHEREDEPEEEQNGAEK